MPSPQQASRKRSSKPTPDIKVCVCRHCLEWHQGGRKFKRESPVFGVACSYPGCACFSYRFDHRE